MRAAHAPESIDQVRLRGTFNQPVDAATRHALLADVMRMLRPGGEVLIHGLCADSRLPGAFPRLPGPAALVQHAPLAEEVIAWLREAGFVSLYLQKLGERNNFEHDGVKMRELMVVGWKPPLAEPASVEVVYRGPFAGVSDDTGRVFQMGERVTVDGATAARLRLGLLGEQLTFIER